MATSLFLDTETYNDESIKVIGGDRYTQSAELLIVTWAINNGPVKLWDATQRFDAPDELVDALADPDTIIYVHNAAFDRKIIAADSRLPSPPIERWRCSMTQALTLALPPDLDTLCRVLGLPEDQAKLVDGKKLVRRFTQPAPKNYKTRRFTHENDPKGWARFCEYARMDVVAMRECVRRMPDWNYKGVELDLWFLDQKINDRGFYVDRELVAAAVAATEEEKAFLRRRFQELTNYEVDSPTKRADLLRFLAGHHYLALENTQKATFEQLLKRRDLSPELRELLEICLAANKTSTSKYARLLPAIAEDNRFRGGLQFAGAGRTRRWCLTGDHEVLTRAGTWVRLDQWLGGDIAVWNTSSQISFQPCNPLVFDYTGPLVAIEHARISQLSTPDHEMPVLQADGSVLRQRVEDLEGKRRVIPFQGFRATPDGVPDTAALRVLLMTQADGHYTSDGVRYHFKKVRKIERCKQLLRRAGIPFRTRAYSTDVVLITVTNRDMPMWLALFSDKTFGPWILNANPEIVLDEIEHWDGYAVGPASMQYSTVNKANADYIQTVAALSGRYATMLTVPGRKKGWSERYVINVWHTPGGRAEVRPSAYSRQQFSGKVYCAQTPTGFFLVRRNGKIWVTGNSGRMYQPQNLPSRGLPPSESVDIYIDCVKAGIHTAAFDDLMRYGAAALRGVVTAPVGKHIVAADLSNIEGRMLAWVAGENWKLDAFRAFDAGTGPDLYKVTAGIITGVDPWKVEKRIRNSIGKVSDLACFTADTPVLTNHGLKRIVDVRLTDKVWDGIKWVTHSGVVDQGVRPVINLAGIEVTPDHLIRTGPTWKRAEQLASNEKSLSRALATGSENLPFLGFDLVPLEGSGPSRSNVHAAQRHTRSCSTTYSKARRLGATSVPRKPQELTQSGITNTPTLSQTTSTGGACSIGSLLVSPAAIARTTNTTQTMVGAAFASCSKIVALFSRIWSRLTGGISPNLSLIESMSTATTPLATFASYRGKKTLETSDGCKISKPESPSLKRVFDIANAGPRTRFTILSDRGWLLVHNCGYSGGVSGFQQFARAYGVKMADYWDVLQETVPDCASKALASLDKPWMRRQIETLEINDTEAVASEACKLAWRKRHPATVAFWYALEQAVRSAIANPDKVFQAPRLKVSCRTERGHRWLQILLPSGRRLCYFDPQIDPETKSISYTGLATEEGGPRIWQRTWTHGGKLTGNVIQSSSRDLLADTMPSVEAAGYEIVLSVHDELVAEAPLAADERRMCEILATPPNWAPDIPLAAAGFTHCRYMKED